MELMMLLLEEQGLGNILVASTSIEKKTLRQLRFSIGDAGSRSRHALPGY